MEIKSVFPKSVCFQTEVLGPLLPGYRPSPFGFRLYLISWQSLQWPCQLSCLDQVLGFGWVPYNALSSSACPSHPQSSLLVLIPRWLVGAPCVSPPPTPGIPCVLFTCLRARTCHKGPVALHDFFHPHSWHQPIKPRSNASPPLSILTVFALLEGKLEYVKYSHHITLEHYRI